MDLSRLADGRLLDVDPMRKGSCPRVLGAKGWEDFNGLFDEITDSVPLTKEEITSLPTQAFKETVQSSETSTVEQKPKMSIEDALKYMRNSPRFRDMTTNPSEPKSFGLGI